MDIKAYFIDELKKVYSDRIAAAARAEAEAATEAERDPSEERRDAANESALQGRLATGHRKRRLRAVSEMEYLIDFVEKGLPRYRPGDRVGLGALVDVEIEDQEGTEERTLFMLPSGAGVELTGPGGDGFVIVVTPNSPVGKNLMRAREGDEFEIVIDGRDREWRIRDVS